MKEGQKGVVILPLFHKGATYALLYPKKTPTWNVNSWRFNSYEYYPAALESALKGVCRESIDVYFLGVYVGKERDVGSIYVYILYIFLLPVEERKKISMI